MAENDSRPPRAALIRRRDAALAALILATAAALLSIGPEATGSCDDSRGLPNFVLILADDMGYGDAELFGMPHLEALAAGGLRWTSFYANSSVCSPTRAALLTGRYPQRAGIDGVIRADPQANRHHGLQPREITFARLLQAAGYATGIFGKWHLGYEPAYNPTRHGFDTFRGYVSGNVDYHSHVDQAGRFDWWHNDRQVREAGYTTHLITRHGVDFIEAHQDKPFVLYLAHEAPHYPYQGPDDEADRTVGGQFPNRGSRPDVADAYREMLRELDNGIGEIIGTLQRLDLAERTLVFFFSDNGAVSPGSNAPLRDGKGSLYEGGIRVPAVAWWPGRIAAGRATDAPAIGMDLMPTLLDLAGVAPPAEHPLDGVSLAPLLLKDRIPATRPLFWQLGNRSAVRDGDWKLVAIGKRPPQLFHLARDVAEQTDLADRHPDRVDAMVEALASWRDDVAATATQQPEAGTDR